VKNKHLLESISNRELTGLKYNSRGFNIAFDQVLKDGQRQTGKFTFGFV